MVSLLWLCHTGAVTCSDQEATAIREAAVMLGIHLNLEQQQSRGYEQRGVKGKSPPIFTANNVTRLW